MLSSEKAQIADDLTFHHLRGNKDKTMLMVLFFMLLCGGLVSGHLFIYFHLFVFQGKMENYCINNKRDEMGIGANEKLLDRLLVVLGVYIKAFRMAAC